MNPEEFDKRLSNCFKNEYLPPDEKLWKGINTRLDQGAKKPFWYWLIPVLIVVMAGGAWLMSSIAGDGTSKNISEEKTEVMNTFSNAKAPDAGTAESNTSAGLSTENNVDQGTVVQSNTADNTSDDSDDNNRLPVTAISERQPVKSNNSNNADVIKNTVVNNRNPKNSGTTNPFAKPAVNNPSPSSTAVTPPENLVLNRMDPRRIRSIRSFIYNFNDNAFAPYPDKFNHKAPETPTTAGSSSRTKNPVDFDKKWWWNFGMGPQVSFNNINVSNDLKDYVHYELWNNKSQLTSNGSGFQTHFLLGYRFAKHFSFETGLQYGVRSEPIKMNVTSYDIASRQNDNKIGSYIRIKLKVIAYNQNTGQYDTTYYDAVSNFALAANNRYHVTTIPIRFNTEWKLTDNTRFIGGIGGGISMISAKKSAHLDIIDGLEITETKLRRFSASLNAHFGFYTNFNDIGELGIYSGFQMYASPWQVNNKQYAIKMSDLQLGISFRRPLNWGK